MNKDNIYYFYLVAGTTPWMPSEVELSIERDENTLYIDCELNRDTLEITSSFTMNEEYAANYGDELGDIESELIPEELPTQKPQVLATRPTLIYITVINSFEVQTFFEPDTRELGWKYVWDLENNIFKGYDSDLDEDRLKNKKLSKAYPNPILYTQHIEATELGFDEELLYFATNLVKGVTVNQYKIQADFIKYICVLSLLKERLDMDVLAEALPVKLEQANSRLSLVQ